MKILTTTVLVLALAALATPAAAAELVVIASTAEAIAPGRVLAAGDALEVPAGAKVTLVSDSGKTVIVEGPHAGPVGGATGGAGDGGIVESLAGLFQTDGKDAGALGAMRAAAGAKPPVDPWVLDIRRSGTFCAPADSPPTLWRAKKSRTSTLSLKNLGDKKRIKANWPAGTDTIAWPAEMALVDGATYLARLKGGTTAAKLTVRLLPATTGADAIRRAAWMADNGCAKQARKILAGL